MHRGPDDGGMVVQTSDRLTVAMGSRRLAILDLSPLGRQPMVNPDTGDVLVYNGEVYNAPELRRTLEGAGLAFQGRSDTEVLLRAYQCWGRGCLDRLRGMFGFALWDSARQRLLLARDHAGIKPLYYASVPGGGFICASEVRALLASGLVPLLIDRRALAGYLAYGAVQEPLTIAQGVRALPAGSWLEMDASGCPVEAGRFWDFPSPSLARPDHGSRLTDVVEQGRALLSQAVRRHLLSDVPVGVFLSSGLDSTGVLGLAQHVMPDRVEAFTVSFPGHGGHDEAPVARETAQRLGVAYHECPVEASTAARWAADALACMDQPAMDGLNTYIVSRAVREQGLKVALSGQGGDEVFGGYRSFRGVPRWHRRMQWLRPMPVGWRARLVGLLAVGQGSVVRQKARDIARTGPDLAGLYFHYRRLLSDADLARLGFPAAELQLTPEYQLPEVDGRGCVVPGDDVASVARLESVFYLRNTLLRDGDVFGMANSLEIRVPFLDRDLLEWALRLPGHVLLPDGAPEKHLLRLMCKEFYSEAQLRQAKRGFTLPLAAWMLGPLRDLVEDSLASLKRSGLVEPRGVDRLYAVFQRESNTAAWSRVWALVTLGRWLGESSVRLGNGEER